jgi:hypothetical protein
MVKAAPPTAGAAKDQEREPVHPPFLAGPPVEAFPTAPIHALAAKIVVGLNVTHSVTHAHPSSVRRDCQRVGCACKGCLV